MTIRLLSSLSTFCQRTRIVMIEVTVLVINRHVRPVSTSQTIEITIRKTRWSTNIIAGKAGRIVEFQPLCQCSINFCCRIETLQIFFSEVEKSSLVQIIERSVIRHLFATTCDTDIVFLRKHMIFIHGIPDICISISLSPTVLPGSLTFSIQSDFSIRKLSILEINHLLHRFIRI